MLAVDAVPVPIGAGEYATPAGLCAELRKEFRRRHPPQLQTVVVQAPAEEGFVGERRIIEVPGMLVNLVLVANRRKETQIGRASCRERV